MASLEENIKQAIADFDAIEQAITDCGVDVPYGTDTKEYGSLIKKACKNRRGYADTSKITDWTQFFLNRKRLEILMDCDFRSATNCQQICARCDELTELPVFNTAKAILMTGAFQGCSNVTSKIFVDFSSVKTATSAFNGCEKTPEINLVSTAQAETLTSLFSGCKALKKVTGLDFSSCRNYTSVFNNTNALEDCVITGTLKIKDSNFKCSASDNLTVETMMSVINAFEDNTGGTTYTVTFGATNVAKLTDAQKQIATNKNITLA